MNILLTDCILKKNVMVFNKTLKHSLIMCATSHYNKCFTATEYHAHLIVYCRNENIKRSCTCQQVDYHFYYSTERTSFSTRCVY